MTDSNSKGKIIHKLKSEAFDPMQDLSLAPKTRRLKRGMGSIPLMEGEILNVQSKARSALECSRLLGVSYQTYKKYAKLYGIFDNCLNPTGLGISKGKGAAGGEYTPEKLLNGAHPGYPDYKFKKRLIDTGYLEEKCSLCGFEERRISDHKVPLALNYKDEDNKNRNWDNLELLCLNCFFLTVGNKYGPRKHY